MWTKVYFIECNDFFTIKVSTPCPFEEVHSGKIKKERPEPFVQSSRDLAGFEDKDGQQER